MSRQLRHGALIVAVTVPALALATLMVAVLEGELGVANASAAYLVAVVLVALLTGTVGAIVAAIGAFLTYNYLFTEPLYTFTISDPGVLLSAVLLLFVAVVVGQLAALQRSRTREAVARAREAGAMFRVSRSLATRESTPEALSEIADILRGEAHAERVWIALGPDVATERVVADTGTGPRPSSPGRLRVLQRSPGDEPARWVRVQRPGVVAGGTLLDAYRVRIEASGGPQGSVWALRGRGQDEPDVVERRLLAAAADQIGQALAHDRVAEETRLAEIARQSDALKSALLQSVSHDLRTPLATIRAAAGSLRPGVGLSDEDRQASADAIDREVEYLNRMVTNLLDLSRIEAGALRADRDVYELDDVLQRVIERARPRLGGRDLEVDLEAPPVEVDPVFLDEAVSNLIDNAVKYTPDGSRIRVTARPREGMVRLTIDDDGPGVPPDALPRLFEKFYRVPRTTRGSRSGTGIGLAVVRGLVEATGGRAGARPGELGGLAIDIDLPAARVPAELVPADRP
jgi:two-component system sensor histidine kinase KdpD